MEGIGTAAKVISGSLVSRQPSAPRVQIDEGNLPAAYDRDLDSLLPRKLWSGWIPAEGKRAIVRALTGQERAALQHRVRALTPALLPYQRPEEEDRVVAALGDMFGSFRSMREKGAAAVALLASAKRMLEPFPAWAIERACKIIQAEGYEVDGRRERHWPPSDAEIIVEVKKAERLRREAIDSALALLAAPVSEDGR